MKLNIEGDGEYFQTRFVDRNTYNPDGSIKYGCFPTTVVEPTEKLKALLAYLEMKMKEDLQHNQRIMEIQQLLKPLVGEK